MNRVAAIAGLIGVVCVSGALAQVATTPMTSIEFLVGFRALGGQSVHITDCVIAGTTSAFIRCEAPNEAGSYSLNAATMNKADLKWSYENCPTGSSKKPACRKAVTGQVEKSAMPGVLNAKFN
jgi:hypothetical protein